MGWGLRLSRAAFGITTPVAFVWRVNGIDLPGHQAPCRGWLAGVLQGTRWARTIERVTELPTEAPMNRQRLRRETRAMAAERTAMYALPREQRRKVAAKLARATSKKARRKESGK